MSLRLPLSLFLPACASPTVTLNIPQEPADECDPPCVLVQAPVGTSLELVTTDAILAQATVVDDEPVSLCPAPGSIPAGTWPSLRHSINGETGTLEVQLDLRPFGWNLGRQRQPGAPAQGTPPSLLHAAEPFLVPEPGTWYAAGITSPTVVDGLLLFGGTDQMDPTVDKTPYRLGAAWMKQFQLTSVTEHPILVPEASDAWDAYTQNAPTVLANEAGFTVWYVGRAAAGEQAMAGDGV